MTYLKLALVFYAVATLAPVPCTCEKAQKENEFANPGKIFSEMEAAVSGGGELSIERSLENLRRIVKRVAPEQNGEYQVYQGVSGQPGVDFPALTSIPATSFTCRGMKGGYYADLETNCQVFHICDNGRKISFLCPNGTIFQQSQLICDWWFKVECSKSAEYYEQSSEQLAEEERKRTESRRNKQQNYDGENPRDYLDVQSLDYDGKQNARVNPSFDEQSGNRLKGNRQFESPSFPENRDPLYSEAKDFQGNSRLESPNYRHSTPHKSTPRLNDDHDDFNRHTTVAPESRNSAKRLQNYQTPPRTSNPREDKVALKRQKFKNVARGRPNTSPANNFHGVSSNTPRYTESTTFRASTQGPRESQQFAESAAFVSNRGNRFNDGQGSHQFYYQLYPNRQDDGAGNSNGNENRESALESKGVDDVHGNVDHSEPTTASTENVNYETTGQFWTTTTTPSPPCHTDHQEFTASHTVTPNPVQVIPTVPPSDFGTRESKSEKFSYTGTTEDHRSSDYTATTPSVFSETTSYYQYNDNRVTEPDFIPTTATPDDYKSTIYPQSEQSPTEASNRDYYGATETLGTSQGVHSNFNDRSDSHSTSSGSGNSDASRYSSSVSQQYRQDTENPIKSTEKPIKSTFPYKPYTLTEKSLSPYDTSFTYKQGKVMSTLGPYVPFTKNYASYTTVKPTTSDSASNVTSPESHSAAKSLIPKLKQSSSTSSALGKSKDHFGGLGYLPEKEHALGMLNSLRNLVEETEVPNSSVKASYNSAPGSSTLHSLALYFSTATDNFDASESVEASASPEEPDLQEEKREGKVEKGSVQVEAIPSGLLTQHTITSYAELFKLNNALESNTTEVRANGYDPEDYNEDLDVQQSSSSLEDQEKKNGTKLRELAQVFTHALSAYLLDPDAFKKVLTEIRPTEPPRTTETTDDWLSTTTAYPTTLVDDTLTTREKDEVLDFSEAENDLARFQVTNTYPTTNTVLPTNSETTAIDQEDISTLPTEFKSPTTRMTTVRATNTVASKSSSSAKEDVASRNRVGGFQNNTVSQVTPQGRAKNLVASHRENYVSSTTPAPQAHYSSSYGWTRQVTSKKPEQQLTPPFYNNNVRLDKDSESGKSQSREGKRHEYPHFLVAPFSSTSSSSIHRGRGINFVINKTEQPSFPTTSERPTAMPSKDYQPPNFVPSKHYEPPQTTPVPSKHYEPPFSTPFTTTNRVFEEPSSTVAPLKLVEEPPGFTPSREYEPPSNERNYNRVRFFKSSQVASGESEETLVTARTGYAKFRNYNRLDINADTSEKKSGKGSTVAPRTSHASTIIPTTTPRSSISAVKSTTPGPSTEPVPRPVQVTLGTSTPRPTTESKSFETTVITSDKEAVTKRNKADSTPNGGLTNDHWTSSPAVTRLWETSVFIDPKRINQGLASDSTIPSTTEMGTTQRSTRGHGDATHETEFDDSGEDFGEQSVDISKDDSNWGWVSKGRDSPTAFTLLPASYSFESTGTPKPLITTRSSITTTITSSVTSTNSVPQDTLVASLLPYSTANRLQVNETEIDVAQKLFGKLNATTTSTLMNVMRQADNNETVRQLVLLLVSYCRDPANDTMEREKDNLLDALLRMPVNEFASPDSRSVVSSFDRQTIPSSFRSRSQTNSTASSRNSGMLAQASTHSGFRRARKYRTTTEGSNNFDRSEKVLVTDNTLPQEDTTVADNRALELLRSLYSIANKWG